MKVYILEHGADYEGSTIDAVYTDRDEANHAGVINVCKITGASGHIAEVTSRKSVWRLGDMWWSVTEHEVL